MGEGGVLRNAQGERFMSRYDADRMELSTRDRVALASYTEIKEGRGAPAGGGVWLDVSHLPRELIMSRLPRVYQTLLELQMLDITREADRSRTNRALSSMGGGWVHPEDHGTDVQGLFAIGEAAAACTAPTGWAATPSSSCSCSAASWAGQPWRTPNSSLPNGVPQRRSRLPEPRSMSCSPPTGRRTFVRCSAPCAIMTERAGVVRDEAGLRTGIAELDEVEARMAKLGVHPDLAGFQDLSHAFDLKSSALAARATLDAALERRETRGCHNRSDYPDLDPDFAGQPVVVPPGPA